MTGGAPGRLARLRRDSGVRMAAGVVLYVGAALAALAVVVLAALTDEQRVELYDVLRDSVATFVLGGLVATSGLAYLLLRGPGGYPSAARRMAGDVRLLLDANPGHRLQVTTPAELADLADAVNALADRRAAAEGSLDAAVADARADLELERDRLAALMADLDVAVLVCSPGGRILLYNSAARTLLRDDPALGLGRSVFALVERELVTHARERLADGAAAARACAPLPDGRLVHVRVSPVRGSGDDTAGFVLVLEDAERLTTPAALVDIAGDDLLGVLRRELEKSSAAGISVVPAPDGAWVRADTYALARAVGHLAGRVRAEQEARPLELAIAPADGLVGLELRWQGPAPGTADLQAWLAEPVALGSAGSVAELLEHHQATVSAETAATQGLLRLLLPAPPAPSTAAPAVRAAAGSRPEFYDFDLFDHPEHAVSWRDRRLADLAYTVFDTETTGFLPQEGDEIVALGAVHVVGGRVRPHEVFERLVDPGRRVPEAAAAVHGITDEMLRGQPTLPEVLPQFARFAEGRVLVGHNVGFDLGFLRAREDSTGVRFEQPALDTLLLDAALHPDHETHSLEAVAARLGIDVIGRHTALGDALVTAEVFVRLLGLLDAQGISTLGQALDASRTTYQARLDATLYG